MYQKRITVMPSEIQKSPALILPGEEFSFAFRLQPPEFPRKYFMRIVGEADLFWKWRQESGIPYSVCNTIEDVLTTKDTPREKFAMEISADGEDYPRNAFMKFFKGDFQPGRKYTFECFGKSRSLSVEPGGEALVELGIYLAKDGRHENDTWDMPDQVQTLPLKEGNHDWEKLSTTFVMPENAVALLLRIGVRKARGGALFGSPRLFTEGTDNLIRRSTTRMRGVRNTIISGRIFPVASGRNFLFRLTAKSFTKPNSLQRSAANPTSRFLCRRG